MFLKPLLDNFPYWSGLRLTACFFVGCWNHTKIIASIHQSWNQKHGCIQRNLFGLNSIKQLFSQFVMALAVNKQNMESYVGDQKSNHSVIILVGHSNHLWIICKIIPNTKVLIFFKYFIHCAYLDTWCSLYTFFFKAKCQNMIMCIILSLCLQGHHDQISSSIMCLSNTSRMKSHRTNCIKQTSL